jgi:hypothetical protein
MDILESLPPLLPDLDPSLLPPLDGDEEIHGTGKQLKDFWRWAYSDLLTNTLRPLIAEYLVKLATHARATRRVEWAPYDVLTPEGIKIEVKSSGFCQSWISPNKPSAVTFSRLFGQPLSEDGGTILGTTPEVRADVFVFAVQMCKDRRAYNALDLTQWRFWVLPGSLIRRRGYDSIRLSVVESLAPPAVTWHGLRDAVLQAAANNHSSE